MIIKGQPDTGLRGRTYYERDGFQTTVSHFVVRETLPGNPFEAHQHEQPEMWYILEGRGTLIGAGRETAVSAGDLITIEPWDEHGLRTDCQVRWICLG